jgi:hypothetical protein
MKLTPHSTRTTHDHIFNITDPATGTVRQATITFEDGRFQKCTFPFAGNYTREQWRMLAELENEICRIEGNQ